MSPVAERSAAGLPVGFADVLAAADAIAGQIVRTPTLVSETLSAILGAEVWLKFENLQFTSSFKERGALYRLLQLDEDERRRGVIAMSAGNHAQGVARHAARLGIPATIVMPRFTPNVKVAGTEALGAKVVLEGDDLGEARVRAEELATEHGYVWVPPYDHPAIIAGQGTCGLELVEDAPRLDAVVVPVGGGGLIAGIALAVAERSPGTDVIGVQVARYPSMVRALRHDPTPLPGGTTLAEGIAVPEAGALTVPIVRALVADVVTVDEDAVEAAVNLLLEIEKTVVEGAGAVGLAALTGMRPRFRGRRVGVVLSGGNADPRVLASTILRGLVRTGRLARLSVDIDDLPGSLARVTGIIATERGNIVEVAHQRLFSDLSVKAATLELAIETRDRAHTEQIVAALRSAGYVVRSGDPS